MFTAFAEVQNHDTTVQARDIYYVITELPFNLYGIEGDLLDTHRSVHRQSSFGAYGTRVPIQIVM